MYRKRNICDSVEKKRDKLGQALWARSKFGLWYAAVGVVKMLHTDNKQKIRNLMQSPSKCRSYVTPGVLYHRPNLERAHKAWPNLYYTVLNCTVLYRTVLYYTHCCIVVRRNCFWAGQYIAIHSNNDFLGFITVNFLEFRSRGEQRRMWREMIIFAYKQAHNQSSKQILIQRLRHTLILCGQWESGPIK